jgi:plasmid stabilization system protein ParE
MPRNFAVQWTEVAGQDLEAIIDYIALDSIDKALSLLSKLRDEPAACLDAAQGAGRAGVAGSRCYRIS